MRYIDYFMFSYQNSFRVGIEILARSTLKKIGVDADPKVLLVGAKAPSSNAAHPVCIEPEDGEWTLAPSVSIDDRPVCPGHLTSRGRKEGIHASLQ
ncbi:MAG: hypothetical protein B7X29_04415 [Halothiobacillus sp. 13-55-115]|jgi:hypothetical protein|nr:MAG: hypothetical protein B7X29_04415 [Halothiobacillus sp. 13-55-115]